MTKNQVNKIPFKNYNLKDTLLGGQSFSWDLIGDSYYGFTQNTIYKLTPKRDELHWQTFPNKDGEESIKKYLRLDIDYDRILKRIQKDEHIKKAIKNYPNLRLLNQDFEQTLLSFLVSANNNIKSIRRSIRMLNQELGKKIKVEDKEFHLFPATAAIANADLKVLLDCSLGFRAKYIKGAAEHLIKTNLASEIHEMGEEEAREALMNIKGVGQKIADCVMCFSLEYDNITPMDVWGKRVAEEFYGIDPKKKYDEIRKWFDQYFEGKAAWAGQFLFEYIRTRGHSSIKK